MATIAAPLGGAPAALDWDVPEQVGLWRDAWNRFRRNRLAVAGLVVIGILIVDALAAPLLVVLGWIQDPLAQDVVNSYAGPSAHHLLGTDELGRDMLSRLMFGARISLTIGIVVQFVILAIGGTIGLTAGYFGGRIDNLLMRFTDIMYAFPDLLFVLIVVAVLGPSLLSIFVAIGIVNWVGLARLVRGQVLSIKEKEFVEGARAAGSTSFKIIVRHLIPNSLGPVIVSLTFGIPAAILLEATLSFLGIGIPPPAPSWGVMVQDGYAAVPAFLHMVVEPALAIAITLLSFTFVGDGLRDALDPRQRK